MRRAPARPVRASFVRSCCSVVVQEHDLRATPVQCNVKQTLSSHFTVHSSHPHTCTSQSRKRRFRSTFQNVFQRKITSAKIAKICWQITIAAWMQPLQYDLRCSAAKDNSITHAAAAPSNLDAATTMRSAETELQNTKELRATVSEIAAPKPDGSRRQSRKNTILKHFLKWFLKGKLLASKLRKSTRKSLSQPGCSHSNTIYDLRLKKAIELRMQLQQQATLSTQGFVLRLPPHNTEHATFMQPFQCNLHLQIQETHRTTHTDTTTRCQTQRRNQSHPERPAAATAAHTRYLSSPAAATLHGKTQGFVLRLPPQNIAHATFMQPFQSNLHLQIQETHRTTHTDTTTRCQTQRRNQSHPERPAAATAAHTRYLSSPAAATLHGKTQGFVLRLPPQNIAHATFMQPFQSNLHLQIQETHRTTHTDTTTRCQTQGRNQSRPERPQPQPPHRRSTFHRRLQPLYTEKHKVSCSGFLPNISPMQHSCRSIFLWCIVILLCSV